MSSVPTVALYYSDMRLMLIISALGGQDNSIKFSRPAIQWVRGYPRLHRTQSEPLLQSSALEKDLKGIQFTKADMV